MTSTCIRLGLVAALAATIAACGGKKPPVVNAPAPAPSAFPAASGGSSSPASTPTAPPEPPAITASPAIASSPLLPWNDKPIDAINGPDSPLKPAFFALDGDTLDDAAQKVLTGDAEVLKTYGTWVVTIEGHCDERGTPEYNLALGDRRALAAKNFLVSLGISADRIHTVSYGNEFPFDTGRTEAVYAANRRAHFMLTSK